MLLARSITVHARWLALSFVLLFLQACGSTIRAPEHVAAPASVFLVDHGIHSSVLFPRDSGEVVAFCFSSYDFAAKDNDGALNGPLVLLASSEGTLGRRVFVCPDPSPDRISRAFMQGETYYRIDSCHEIVVERAARERVLSELEGIWTSEQATRVDNAKRRFSFVRVPARYGLFHTCNHASVQLLREMGCGVSGIGIAADFDVRPSEGLAGTRAAGAVARVPEPRAGDETLTAAERGASVGRVSKGSRGASNGAATGAGTSAGSTAAAASID